MTVTLNSSPLVLATLQNLSGPRSGNGMARSLSRLKASTSEVRAFGGLDLIIQRGGREAPAKMRYGAITITPRAQGSAYSRSPGVNTVVDRAYDNPGVRFGDYNASIPGQHPAPAGVALAQEGPVANPEGRSFTGH